MSTAAAAAIGAGVCLAAAPYLAGLTVTAPDRGNGQWWRSSRPSPTRLIATALIAAFLGGLAGATAGWSAALPAYVSLALATAALVIIDLEHHRLPDRLVGSAALTAVALLTAAAAADSAWSAYARAWEAAAAVLAVLGLLFLISPRAFGLGDVKLGGVLGAYLGWAGWPYVYYGIFAGFLLGSVVGVALMASRRASMRTALPFGPMLVLGALIVLAFDLTPTLTT